MIVIHDYDTPSPKTFHLVFQGMRYSWDSGNKADSDYQEVDDWHAQEWFNLGPADKQLALKLIRAGTDHSKFMRQLPIVVDITGPNYWWREMDTYRIGTCRNSASQMHTLGREKFTEQHFSWEDLNHFPATVSTLLDELNEARELWIAAGKRKGPNEINWRAMVQLIPDSWNYRSLWSANYAVLRNIYFARRNHRLREWRDFCTWIETLPYSELITEENKQ